MNHHRSRTPHAGRMQSRSRPAVESLEGRRLLSFSAPITSGGAGHSVAVADFNADGLGDVVVFSGSNSVGVRLGNGDGTFRKSSTLSGVKGSPDVITAADLNGDGKVDVRAISYSETRKGSTTTRMSHTTTWLGNGNGTFAASTMTSGSWSYGIPYEPQNAYTTEADFNNDGVLDGASLHGRSTGVITVGVSTPDGTGRGFTCPAGPSPGAIAAGDFNGDGWMDIVVVNSLSSDKATFAVLLNGKNW